MVAALALSLLHPYAAAVAGLAGLVAVIKVPRAARVVFLVAAALTGAVAVFFLFAVGD